MASQSPFDQPEYRGKAKPKPKKKATKKKKAAVRKKAKTTSSKKPDKAEKVVGPWVVVKREAVDPKYAAYAWDSISIREYNSKIRDKPQSYTVVMHGVQRSDAQDYVNAKRRKIWKDERAADRRKYPKRYSLTISYKGCPARMSDGQRYERTHGDDAYTILAEEVAKKIPKNQRARWDLWSGQDGDGAWTYYGFKTKAEAEKVARKILAAKITAPKLAGGKSWRDRGRHKHTIAPRVTAAYAEPYLDRGKRSGN